MVSLIIGRKGSGKTKELIALVNDAVESSKGSVLCVEKETKLTYDVSSRARLVASDYYGIKGFDEFYGFLSGLCAGDHDITHIFIDATLRIGSRDYNELAAFLKRVYDLGQHTDSEFIFTVSADREDLPEEIFDFIKNVDIPPAAC